MLKLELTNGEQVDLTLNYGMLYVLRDKRPDAYKAYFKGMNVKRESEDSIFATPNIIYAAYLCAIIGKHYQNDAECDAALEKAYSARDFMMLLPEDIREITYYGAALIDPKEIPALETYLTTLQAGRKSQE